MIITHKVMLGHACALALLVATPAGAQVAPSSPAGSADHPTSVSLRIAPCSTTVSVARLTLAETTLEKRGDQFVGRYRISVSPFFFMSRKGTFTVTLSEAALRKIEGGSDVNFTGTAVSQSSGKSKNFQGRATPTAADRGNLKLSFRARDQPVVFETSYRLSR